MGRRGRRKDFRSSGSRSGIMCRALVLLIALLPSTLPQLTRPTDVPSCHLPAGRAAVCVPIAACSHLASLVGNLRAPLPRDVALLLRDSFFCSGTGSGVQVCCPVEGLVSPSSARPQVRDRPDCAIQDGPAECVAYNVCSPFVQLLSNLKKPLHPVVPTMVRSSYLCGREEDSSGSTPGWSTWATRGMELVRYFSNAEA